MCLPLPEPGHSDDLLSYHQQTRAIVQGAFYPALLSGVHDYGTRQTLDNVTSNTPFTMDPTPCRP